MKDTLKTLSRILGPKLGKMLTAVCATVNSVVGYLRECKADKKDREQKKENKKVEDKIDDVCRHGTIKDLIEL